MQADLVTTSPGTKIGTIPPPARASARPAPAARLRTIEPPRARSRRFVRARAPKLTPTDAQRALDLLACAGRHAVEAYDVALFAVVLRALTRLPHVPYRLLRDATDLLAGQQDLDGAIGAPLMDDPEERLTLHRQWTLVATTALVEAACALAVREPFSHVASSPSAS
ncbi:hypothetical protein [Oerskovia turbata]